MNRTDLRGRMQGNFMALPTPCCPDQSIDTAALRELIRYLLDKGLKTGNAIYLIGGAGGEFAALDLDERKRIAEVAVEEVAGQAPVVVGAQHTNPRAAIELARFAREIGADAIQLGPPYYEPPSEDDVFEFFRRVSDAVDIPLVVYNTWWTGTHADIGLEGIDRLLNEINVGALKWSSPSFAVYEAVLSAYAERVAIIDNQLSEVLSHMLGATGFVSHPPVFWPEYGIELWDHLQAERYDQALVWLKRLRMPYYIFFAKAYAYSGGEGHVDKAALELVDRPVGPPRSPTRPMTSELREELRQMLVGAGVPNVMA